MNLVAINTLIYKPTVQQTMKTLMTILLFSSLFLAKTSAFGQISSPPPPPPVFANDTLVVVWSSGDIEVAEKVCFMYTYNAKKWAWFKEVIFVVWGSSAKLLAENDKLQESVKKMKEEGIILEACMACARMYNVQDKLKELGIDVKGMGTVLTKYLKAGYPNITF